MDWKAKLSENIDRCARQACAVLDSVACEWDGKPPSELKRQLDEKIQKLERAQTKSEAASVKQDILELQKIVAAWGMSSIIGKLKDMTDAWMLANNTYELGYLMGTLERTILIGHPDFHKLNESLSGLKYADQQWEKDRLYYREAETDAEVYYVNGGIKLHDALAKDLAKKYLLSVATVRERIKPIARRYGKVRGEKK